MKVVFNYCGGVLKQVKKNAGFTLLELTLSMGILMILITLLTTVFGQILDVQLESKSLSSVDQNGRYILAKLTHDMQNATSITSPSAAGVPSGQLQLLINTISNTYSVSNSGNLVIINNNGTDVLNSYTASVSGLTFTRIGNGGNSDTLRVSFTLTSRVQRPEGFEQKNFQTTLGLN